MLFRSLIARFQVGSSVDRALTRVRTRLDEAAAALPEGARVAWVSPRSIDDVPVLALTLSAPGRGDFDQSDLRRVAAERRAAPGPSSANGGSERDPARRQRGAAGAWRAPALGSLARP